MAKPGLHLEKECPRCTGKFRQIRSDQVYCSTLCCVRDWRDRKRAPKKCVGCGTEFTSNAGNIYCTVVCRQSADSARRKKNNSGATKAWSKGKEYVARRICHNCEKSFYAPPVQMRRGGGKYCSVGCWSAVRSTNPALFPRHSGPRGITGKRPDLDNRFFRSRWEANYARYLNWLKKHEQILGWDYECQTFEFEGIKRGTRFYTPDFKVTTNDGYEWHEVKGWMDPKSATKLKRMKKYHPKEVIRIIDKAVMKSIEKMVAASIPTWERPK